MKICVYAICKNEEKFVDRFYESAKEADAILKVKDGIATLEFKEPQRAITPGQSVVFYIDNNIVLGGGKII